jgi:hypothetical protein
MLIDVSYVVPQAHGIVNVAFHRDYSLGIVFIYSQGRKYLYESASRPLVDFGVLNGNLIK